MALMIVILILILVLTVWFFVYRKNKKQKLSIQGAEKLVMLKILLPKLVKRQEEKESQQKDFREVMSVAEQLFSAFASIYKKGLEYKIFGQIRTSFEIIAKDGLIYFYVGIPKELQNFTEKQIQGIYPDAEIETSKDFKIFSSDCRVACGMLKLREKFVFPVKTYKNLENEPLNSLTNSLSKLGKDSKATIQVLIKPTSGNWKKAVEKAAGQIVENKPVTESWFGKIIDGLISFLQSSKNGQDRLQQEKKLTPIQEQKLKLLQEKQSKIGFKTQIKVVVTSPTEEEAKINLDNILNSYSQYTSPESNGFKIVDVRNKSNFITSFILREFNDPYMILNTEELASVFHFPSYFVETPNIFWLKSKILPAPNDVPKEGIFMGENHYRGEVRKIYINNDDRRRHVYMVGKTGTGKTTLYLNMIKQDIEMGHGCCFVDPNGDAAESVLRFVPKQRAEDVIYFDPSDSERPMGLNLLEWKRPEDKDYLIAEWLEIFQKLFDPNRTGMVGPQFEHWGRNAALTVMAQPGGGTLLEIPRLFTDDDFREKCTSYLKDPVVIAFWEQQMAKTADFHKSEMYNYFISKFGRFLTNDLMRNIIGQAKSAFDFRKIMDEGKILIVNLSKGKLGEMNSYLLGMILVSKIQVAAFQRADTPEEERKDFYLYVDEFQNFTTDSFKTILSEARKYRLSLSIAHQYVQQLSEPIRDACIGNAGTIISYRVGAQDAEFLAKEFPGVSEQDITNLPFATMYIKLLIDGTPSKPFSMRGIKDEPSQTKEMAQSIRQLSRLKYGRSKNEVDADVKSRTLTVIKPDQPADVDPGPAREHGA
jgi:hypothetical protein